MNATLHFLSDHLLRDLGLHRSELDFIDVLPPTPIAKGIAMSNNAAATEAVVRNHLRVFLEQRGIPAILEDYHDDARLYSEDRLYRGKQEIRDFFTGFIESLPPGSIGRFTLRSLRVDGNFAYLTWSAGKQIPLGADTFVVTDGKIAAQTFAMFARG